MSNVPPGAAEVPHGVPLGVPRGPQIPLLTLLFLMAAALVGIAAHHVPDVATPVSLALATFLTLERVTRQIN